MIESDGVVGRRSAIRQVGMAAVGLVGAVGGLGLAVETSEARKESLSNSKKKKKTRGEKKHNKNSEKKRG